MPGSEAGVLFGAHVALQRIMSNTGIHEPGMNSELTPNPPTRGPSAYAGVTDQIAVGRYALEIGYLRGALVHEASRAERAHVRPRATPILLRPRLIRGLLDRQTELASALSSARCRPSN